MEINFNNWHLPFFHETPEDRNYSMSKSFGKATTDFLDYLEANFGDLELEDYIKQLAKLNDIFNNTFVKTREEAEKLPLNERIIENLNKQEHDFREINHFSQLWIAEKKSSNLFAIVVFLCDAFLQIKQNLEEEKEAKNMRFFKIAQRLPMELQQTLCNRAFGREADQIKQDNVNTSIDQLGKKLKQDESSLVSRLISRFNFT